MIQDELVITAPKLFPRSVQFLQKRPPYPPPPSKPNQNSEVCFLLGSRPANPTTASVMDVADPHSPIPKASSASF